MKDPHLVSSAEPELSLRGCLLPGRGSGPLLKLQQPELRA